MRIIITLFLSFFFFYTAVAQQEPTDSLMESNDYSFGSFIKKSFNKLTETDDRYISPNKYNFTFMFEYSRWYEYYELRAKGGEQSISFSPDSDDKLGFYIGWKWLFLGWAFDVNDLFGKKNENTQKTDLNFSFYTPFLGIDIFYKKNSNNFQITDLENFKDYSTGKEITNYNDNFKGLNVSQSGLNLYYIFNHKHFSYPAAYSQSTNQRISCGTFVAGITLSQQELKFDAEKLDANLFNAMDSSLMFNKISYQDISVNLGYSYNWVFAKNFLANISLTPTIGYKYSSLRSNSYPDVKSIFKNINFDLISRIALVYNNSKYYIGLSMVTHTYSYRRDNFSIVNGFGVFRLYTGINIWRKK